MANSSEATKRTARSAIRIDGGSKRIDDWEVSTSRISAPLTLADVSAATKIKVVATPGSPTANALNCAFGSTRREDSALIVGTGPDEWLILAPGGQQPSIVASLPTQSNERTVVVIDVTHAGVLLRLSGAECREVLTRMCAMNFSDEALGNGSAFRSSLARLVCDVARDDVQGQRSYLIHSDRSSGQYLFDSFTQVGAQFGLSVTGYPDAGL